ncbi:hypothetical protein EXIGLDRAFT_835620 [Exidia glandulosa HHB12029]|uniref:F-box domain-containing protein n=1 Tax=Exidia glandulosa HHB12029 TaxID=1314781 RepID=A0A165IL40_EXIGL|nr:hypothetical protein EXIGLDRAFT_835620 [Exidia glandulosa HHB12029]
MLLSPRILARLRESIENAMKDAREETSADSGATLADLAHAVREACNDSISSVVRAIEAGPFQIPEEIWGLIWSSLPLADLVTATHVCRAWRAAALDIPALWTEIVIMPKRHASTCDCAPCSASATAHDRPCTLNTRRLAVLLNRSRGAPLDVCIYMWHATDLLNDDGSFALICSMLGQHSSRLVSLEARLSSGNLLHGLMMSLNSLPLLRCLLLRASGSTNLSSLPLVAMPKLATLRTGPSVLWDALITTAPALLAVSVSVQTVTELVNVLSSVPALRDLELYLGMQHWSGTAAELAAITQRCGNLQLLKILSVSPSITASQLSVLVPLGIGEVCINASFEDLVPDPTIVLFTLTHLSGSIHLTFESEGEPIPRKFNVIARDEHRTRRLELPAGWLGARSFPRIWTQISTSSIVFMDVPWAYRTLVLATNAAFPALEHLVITPEWLNRTRWRPYLRSAISPYGPAHLAQYQQP